MIDRSSCTIPSRGGEADLEEFKLPLQKLVNLKADILCFALPLLFSMIVNPRAMHLHPLDYFPKLPMDRFKEWCEGLAMSREDIDRISTVPSSHNRLTPHVCRVEIKIKAGMMNVVEII